MFTDLLDDLAYLSRQLSALRPSQLFRLACWLGTFGLPYALLDHLSKEEANNIKANVETLVMTEVTFNEVNKIEKDKNTDEIGSQPADASKSTIGCIDASKVGTPTLPNILPDKPVDVYKAIARSSERSRRSWDELLGLHLLYKRIAAVADSLTHSHPQDLREILQVGHLVTLVRIYSQLLSIKTG
ncbi:unnamed protein product [Protopolystoma xenopodis]|uniref:Uncharacterized protein n=1 Tax=Protopolystoma xenopodis TaxID=117903 RepID=A0A3S5BN12_9PLAT|nr:unnamed protein product [Protopolystoma xenopodis]